MKLILFRVLIVLSCIQISTAAIKLKPTPLAELSYQQNLLDGNYDAKVTPPEQILGFDVGQKVASPAQIEKALMIWKEQSDRLKVVEYARSHENRPLFVVYITLPNMLKNLGDIQSKVAQLAHPADLSPNETKTIIDGLPAISWMAYSIHGNESSGSDAALAAIYHLIADQSQETLELLDDQLVIIDPMMNPDGRARFAKELQESRGVAANVDTQSLLHSGSWPYGRTNHYYFDLNRDFIYTTQPETKGRVKLLNLWYPQLMIDAHEMGATDTFLFAPAREPKNPHLPESLGKWGLKFAEDQAQAFDKNGWRYYTGEWFENFFAGYSNYVEYRGSVHILYEQARIAEDGVRREDGSIVTYQEAVHHQLVSTLANLKTLKLHSKNMYKDFVAERKKSISKSGRYANRSFAVLPSENKTRMRELLDALKIQNINVYRLEKAKSVSATDQLGIRHSSYTLPKGTMIIPNRQAEANLIAAMLEFDVAIKKSVLIEERQKLLRDGSSVMYDTTAWNLTMMLGIEALTVEQHMENDLVAYTVETDQSSTTNKETVSKSGSKAQSSKEEKETIAYVVNGLDDASVAFAARLLEQGVHLRVLDKATELSGKKLPRGSVVMTKMDNVKNSAAIKLAQTAASELQLELISVQTGYGEGDLPDWGGRHFPLLKRPQIALLARGGFSAGDVGATWFSIDSQLGIRHSQLNSLNLGYADLRRYNVLIMPHQYRNKLTDSTFKSIEQWIRNGGTLIAFDGTVKDLMEHGLTSVKHVSETFEDAEKYDLSLHQEWLAKNDELDMEKVNSTVILDDFKYPWDAEVKRFKKDELEKRDQWQAKFMPAGAFVAARVDEKHWLSFGVNQTLPILFSDSPVLMSNERSEAVTRIGVLQDKESGALSKLADLVFKKPRAIGWSTLPEDHNLIVRMSGLLWPEAAQRIANGAHLTRERLGRGQVILFATSPNFRGATKGTNRLFLNAVVYGPGLGASNTVAL